MAKSLPPPIFIAGSVGLDFLNSIAVPVDEIVDWLGNGEDLLSWLRQAGLLTSAEVLKVRSRMSRKELDAAAAEARALREWFRGFVKSRMGRFLKRHDLSDLGPLRKLLGADEVSWTIEPAPRDSSAPAHNHAFHPIFQLQQRRHWESPASLLSPVAEEIAHLICEADFRYIRGCEGKSCVLLFLDQTRRKARRWCSMEICGNRAKQAAHQKRLRRDKRPRRGA
jgi:predicted RNA-binding Zn ribbon-like protein